jgi:hypothetical protein
MNVGEFGIRGVAFECTTTGRAGVVPRPLGNIIPVRTMTISGSINGFGLGGDRILLPIVSGRLRGSDYRRFCEVGFAVTIPS